MAAMLSLIVKSLSLFAGVTAGTLGMLVVDRSPGIAEGAVGGLLGAAVFVACVWLFVWSDRLQDSRF